MLNTSMLELFDNIKVWNVLLFVGLIALWAVSEKRNERRRKTSLEKSQAEEQAREQKILESISKKRETEEDLTYEEVRLWQERGKAA